jgi:hypothetical protein
VVVIGTNDSERVVRAGHVTTPWIDDGTLTITETTAAATYPVSITNLPAYVNQVGLSTQQHYGSTYGGSSWDSYLEPPNAGAFAVDRSVSPDATSVVVGVTVTREGFGVQGQTHRLTPPGASASITSLDDLPWLSAPAIDEAVTSLSWTQDGGTAVADYGLVTTRTAATETGLIYFWTILFRGDTPSPVALPSFPVEAPIVFTPLGDPYIRLYDRESLTTWADVKAVALERLGASSFGDLGEDKLSRY